MRVRLTKPLGQHAKDSEHEVSDAIGKRLIRKGCAERVGAKKPTRTRAQLEPRRRVAKGEKIGTVGGGSGTPHVSLDALPSGMTEVRNTTGEDEPLTDPK